MTGRRLIPRGVVVVVAVAFVALLGFGLTSKPTDTSLDEALRRGEALPAPGFALAPLERRDPGRMAAVWDRAAASGRVDLDEFRGTPVALNFWASWCDPCRTEIEVLERHWRTAERDGVLVVGLNQQDAREEARAFLDEHGVTFPSVRETGKDSARDWGVTGMPETFFISARGDVVGHVIGAISDDEMRAGLEAARTGRPSGVSTGGEQRRVR